ncbi:HNH endonuclease [Anoxybacillus flavithermus]|uniref:HNH nuclease n=1 Tax=Anoxybacillus flavithermus TaxID=33934 RepID=A0A178TN17_9BACL|nr:HNH endonuclease [Anoxybacillus flavithermus]OAO82597.1 HNH nuclease [Anoxybacillus flavithermus]
MLLTKTVEVDVTGNVSYYESKGYSIPKYIDKLGNLRVKKGTKIVVLVSDLPETSGIEIEYQCNSCKQIFKTRYYRYLKNEHDLCKSCNMKRIALDKNNISKRSGINHPKYNPNLTDKERECGRNYPEYIEWRKRVYEECSYTCQCCGDNKGGNLVAHHLNGWHWCKDERFVDFNGIALCESCHNKFHKKYGYQNNTREQFIEFLIDELQKKNYSEASKVFTKLD